jgi:indolepyruvate ferredoxin oxidoreductase alpha subunit
MGASEGLVHGIRKVTDQKTIAFVGDSTFFHAGFPGLVNTVFNKSNPLIIILDNRITAMTGHQPNPGVGVTGTGEPTKEIAIEDVVKACKIENVKVVDPFNLKETAEAIKEFLNKEEVSVIIAKRECQLLAIRKMKKAGIKIPKFEIDKNKCKKCGTCIMQFGCPAIMKAEDGSYYIDKDLCTGCAVCVQVCPNNAIHVVE